jgi:nitrate reductase gamma subunit
MLADAHNRYDTTSVDIFITLLLVSCVVIGVLIKRMLNDESQR